jgi:threonyl-tRNA synthetase
MSQITITLPDGSQRGVSSGTPVRDFAAQALPQGVMRKALAAVVNGQLVDLGFPLAQDATLRIVTPDGP